MIPEHMTLTAFAEIMGVSKMSVSRACKTGRLRECVVRSPSGMAIGITDADLARQEWEANTDPTRKPESGTKGFQDAKERKEFWAAETAELKFKQAAGELVPESEVRREWSDILSNVRTKLLAIPTRVKQEIPILTPEQVLKIEDLIRESLQDLAEDK